MTAAARQAPLPPASGEGTLARPAWVLLRHEAAARGFRNALCFRRWLRRSGVAVRKSGRLEFVNTAAVDAAIAGTTADRPQLELTPRNHASDLAALAAASVARTFGGAT